MQKIIGMNDFEKDFRAVIDEVAQEHVPYVLTRNDRPHAVLVPYDDFLRLEEVSQGHDSLREFDAMWARMQERTAKFSEEEIAADIAAARAELPG